jgi:hypothetical protein
MLTLLLAVSAAVTPQDAQIPAGRYWQQRVAYTIRATLDEPTGVLTGHERIVYVNQSPDTLRDFSVHDYLNAFRPGSRWAAYDSASGVVRYQHMADPDYAFERITGATIMGQALRPDYPVAPDSTIAHWSLPRPLAPGDSFTVEIDWQARLSTLPRRQGRDPKTRRYDFAQWYPKVVVYDRYGWENHPLYPPGEFYGEFGTFDVTLDLPEDQVIGATGVPVCGDPGWEGARANPAQTVDYQRDWYPDAPHDCPGAAAGRKTVRFFAKDVHHFAFTLNPHYVFEQGRYRDVAVRVLYQPQDRTTWGNGIAVKNTETALAWLDSVYGKFQWPELTNVHRIEGGGTEFPMMIMDGGPDLGLIIHEGGHQYTMGQLANNEWREGYLDEGFTSFQTGLYFETHGRGVSYTNIEPFILGLDLDGWSEPVSMVSERYSDFNIYNIMIYTKGQLFYEELRYVVGDDTLRKILHVYFDRWKLKHVDEARFRAVCEEVSGQDLSWFFAQWLHGTPLFDYRLAKVERHQLPDGRWHTAVTIDRLGTGWMPVEIGDGSAIYARATGQPAVERVEFTSAQKPGRLVLDPRGRTHDWNYTNNFEWRPFQGRASVAWRLDDPTRETTRRDGLVDALMPTLWYNDFGGVTLGLRTRENYMGTFDQGSYFLSAGLKSGAADRFGFHFTLANPTFLRHTGTVTTLSAWDVEGRAGASVRWDQRLSNHWIEPSDPHWGLDGQWMSTTDVAYLDRRLWDDAGTLEMGPWFSDVVQHGATVIRMAASAHGGVVYRIPGPGIVSTQRYDVDGYGRVTGEASIRTPLAAGARLGIRVYGGGYLGNSVPALQRRIYVAGADPYETFTDPFLRSRGAWFARPGFYYQSSGGAGLRGFRDDLGGRWAFSANVEGTRNVFARRTGFLRGVTLEGFLDAGVVDTMAVPAAQAGTGYTTLWDAGVGVVTRHAVRDLTWTMRFELPLLVNRWDEAADVRTGEGRLAFRWSVSLAPSF